MLPTLAYLNFVPELCSLPCKGSILNILLGQNTALDRKSTRLNSSHLVISYAVFCLKKKKKINRSKIGYLIDYYLVMAYYGFSIKLSYSHIRYMKMDVSVDSM